MKHSHPITCMYSNTIYITMNHLRFNLHIVSTQSIQPSTPTPLHLHHFPLSSLDHLLAYFEYTDPLILFYASAANTLSPHRLKISLSRTLSLFYPYAGRLSPDLTTILCYDQGVPLVVARLQTTLSTFLTAPNRLDLLPHFLPPNLVFLTQADGWVPLAIQLTQFHCGGIAIGCHALNKACIDGITRDQFFKTWAAINAGRHDDVIPPDLTVAQSLFPPSCGPHPMKGGDSKPKVLAPVHNEGDTCIVKPFYFSPRSIKALQSMARTELVSDPTRVETVSAFLWKHLMAAALALHSSTFLESKRNGSVVIHSVNMRPHIKPPQPPQALGKFTTHAIVECDNIQNGSIPDIFELVAMIRKAFSDTKHIKFVSKFIGKQGQESTRQHKQKVEKLSHDPNKITYFFTSWSGVQVDFGVGMPVWVGFMGGKVSRWFRNYVPLIHLGGGGIEAWLVLDEEEMRKLESDLNFLVHASPSAPPIHSPTSML